ncbi:MAG: hypothetical protein KGN16_15255 [Burkholderiales bacterium]|nr:hypothetical protein [Burkholderiales bacterium]
MDRSITARLLIAVAAALLVGGCDQLGIESASAVAARREAEGKAIGGGCRYSARSIEQCYENNKRAEKAAIFAGWREMNDYMRDNKLDAQPAPAEPTVADKSADGAASDAADEAPAASAPEKKAKKRA